MPQQAQTDPWEEAAKNFKPTAGSPAPASEDWKLWQKPEPAGTINTPGQMLGASGKLIGNLGSNVLKGLGESAVSTIGNIGNIAHKLVPSAIRKASPQGDAMIDMTLNKMKDLGTPANTTQGVFKGAGDTAQFFIPGQAEEALAAKLPMLGKLAKPLARMAGAETVNQAQGGPTGAGAAGAGLGEGLAAGMRRLAPFAAETAMRIGTKDRAFGKTPGQAILDETRGIHPATVGASAQDATDRLMARLEQATRDASQRPTPPIRGFLMPPVREVPLHNAPDIAGELSQPVRLTQADRPGRPLLPSPSLSTPMASGHQVEFPERLASGDTSIRPNAAGSPHSGMGQAQYIGQISGDRGGIGQSQGVMLERPPMSASIPPTVEANPMASLRPARDVIANAQRIASDQNAAGRYTQLGNMGDTLSTHFEHGPIPEQVTPLHLLNLKRGFSDEHLGKWNPDIHEKALAAGRGAYRALDSELDRTVPAAAETNQRLSSLIPVLRSADKLERAPSFLQRTAGRVAAHTGALTGAGIGAVTGYKEGGVGGALAGGTAGLLLPEIVASPETQMAMARTLGSKGLQKAATPLAAAGTSKLAKLIQDLRSRQ